MLGALNGMSLELGHRAVQSANTDEVSILVLDASEIDVVGGRLEEFESFEGAKINKDKSVWLLLDTGVAAHRPTVHLGDGMTD